ncbi:Branched-chain amino acid ABC transporter, amino acid-binding protein [Rubellimicrobium mesophilum DSM 19309]|uniref:Branched-chain amino acid ABC transporter, amino acid-binding protein n=1 Tax=Rubellimicrobium mesophilum DSM 19309 TaxID=442562 RepID=A0A017HNI2_9RHOB|nr:Branched-chain amino acid ABC transporter, amino acid-binding protein [Rubellimicrobium mesophilum DSM 19309]
MRRSASLLALALAAGFGQAAFAQDCEVTVGLVMELTGPAGAYGQAGAKAVEMAFHDLNEAGGVLGCQLVPDTRDSQSQGNVAVDQARQLVDIGQVPVIIGGIISSVSIPILTSVTAPAGVVQVSPASSSPTLTQMAKDGQTGAVLLPHHHLGRAAGRGGGEIRGGFGADQPRHHPGEQRLRREHGARVRRRLPEARRHHHLGHVLQREPAQLRRRGDGGDGGRPAGALPHQLSGGRGDHRADLDQPGRAAEVPAERRHELLGLHRGGGGAIPERRLRHLLGDHGDGLDEVLQRQLRGLLRGDRALGSGGGPVL